MKTAGVFRRAAFAAAVTEAALACTLAAAPTLTAVPADIGLPGGPSVPAPSSTPSVTVPSDTVGPVTTPEVTVPSEPVPSTSGSGVREASGGPSLGGPDPRCRRSAPTSPYRG